MALSVQTNTAAITALKNLNTNSQAMNNSLNRLSSGFRINSAADDASGFAVSSKLDAQSGRLKAASQNATQATAMVKMADAGVNEIQNMINRIQTLATQAASSNNAGELGKLDSERVKLESQINKIADSTNYNGVNLLNGIDANSQVVSAVTGVAATAGTISNGTAVTGKVIGTAAFSTAATFTMTTAANGTIKSITSSADLLATADGATLAKAGVNLLSSANATNPTKTPAALAGLGLTFSNTNTATTGAAGTTTVAFTAGTDQVTGSAAGAALYTATSNTFQVGADNNINNQVSVDLSKTYTTTGLNLGSGTGSAAGGDLKTQAAAQLYIDTAKSALNTLITQRADLGATQNQLVFVQANLATSIEQTTASVSAIKDADMAMEMANFTKNKILTQAGTSMLAQANQASQNVLTLFR